MSDALEDFKKDSSRLSSVYEGEPDMAVDDEVTNFLNNQSRKRPKLPSLLETEEPKTEEIEETDLNYVKSLVDKPPELPNFTKASDSILIVKVISAGFDGKNHA